MPRPTDPGTPGAQPLQRLADRWLAEAARSNRRAGRESDGLVRRALRLQAWALTTGAGAASGSGAADIRRLNAYLERMGRLAPPLGATFSRMRRHLLATLGARTGAVHRPARASESLTRRGPRRS